MGSLRHHGALALGHRGELDLADVEVAQHLVVDDGDAALPDGAHGQFRLVRHAELADDDDIERRTERGGDLRRDGDTTAGSPSTTVSGPRKRLRVWASCRPASRRSVNTVHPTLSLGPTLGRGRRAGAGLLVPACEHHLGVPG